MKIAKRMAAAGALAEGVLVGVGAQAASTSTAVNDAHPRCEQQVNGYKAKSIIGGYDHG